MIPYNLAYRQSIIEKQKLEILESDKSLKEEKVFVDVDNVCLDYDPLLFINEKFTSILAKILKTGDFSLYSEIEILLNKYCISPRNNFFSNL